MPEPSEARTHRLVCRVSGAWNWNGHPQTKEQAEALVAMLNTNSACGGTHTVEPIEKVGDGDLPPAG